MNPQAPAWRLVTPSAQGRSGAIAIIQVTGDAETATRSLGLTPLEAGAVRLQTLGGVDQAIVARPAADCLLLMPHAGPAVMAGLGEWLVRAGIAPHGRFPRYPEAASELEERMLAALAAAQSPLAIDLLLDQARRWREHPEPDPDLDRRSAILRRLVDPALVVALGPPNIGKSTLLNTLAGRAAAIVADVPGTTRDHVGVRLELAGLVVDYIDTPGLSPGEPGADQIQAEAQALALGAASRAELVLLCADATAALTEHPCPSVRALRVGLRSDLGAPVCRCDARVSARTGEGIPSLVGLIRDTLVPPEVLADPRPWRFWEPRAGTVPLAHPT